MDRLTKVKDKYLKEAADYWDKKKAKELIEKTIRFTKATDDDYIQGNVKNYIINTLQVALEELSRSDSDTSLWHDLKEDKPPLRKWVMFRYNGGGVKPTSLHYGAMSDDLWIVTRGDGTQRIEVLYECYDKIEWLDFDELK